MEFLKEIFMIKIIKKFIGILIINLNIIFYLKKFNY